MKVRVAVTALAVSALLAVGGCSSVKFQKYLTFSEYTKRNAEAANDKASAGTSARVGEVMASYQPRALSVEEKLYQTLVMSGGLPTVSGNVKFRTFNLDAGAGSYIREATNGGYLFYRGDGNFRLNGANTYGGVVTRTSAPASAIGVYWTSTGWGHTSEVYYLPLLLPVSGELKEKVERIESPAYAGVRREFIYNGLSNGIIHFIYKEFTDAGMARPAFTTLVDLDYAQGKKIVYQELEFVVNQADTTHIEYTVLKNFSAR